MSEQITTKEKWAIGLRFIGWFALALLFLFSIRVLGQVAGELVAIAVVIAAILTLVIALIVYLVQKLRHKPGHWWQIMGKAGLITFALIMFFQALPIYYFSAVDKQNPSIMPTVTMTDGEKVVTYQGMMHIGSEAFYKGVVFDLVQALNSDAVWFAEGVDGSEEASKWVFTMVGAQGGDLTGAYEALGEVCGLTFQSDYFTATNEIIKEHPDQFVVADVTTDAMKAEWERLVSQNPELEAQQGTSSVLPDPDSEQVDDLSATVASILPEDENLQWVRDIEGLLCRGLLFARKKAAGADQGDFDRLIILDFRNRNLADMIVNDPHDNIYITYGAAHLPGLYYYLRQENPDWEIISVDWERVIKSPDDAEGELQIDSYQEPQETKE